MNVQFTLVMEQPIVCGMHFDEITIQWFEDMEQVQILDVSHEWIRTSHFLTQRMEGLTYVGESSLTIEPLD